MDHIIIILNIIGVQNFYDYKNIRYMIHKIIL